MRLRLSHVSPPPLVPIPDSGEQVCPLCGSSESLDVWHALRCLPALSSPAPPSSGGAADPSGSSHGSSSTSSGGNPTVDADATGLDVRPRLLGLLVQLWADISGPRTADTSTPFRGLALDFRYANPTRSPYPSASVTVSPPIPSPNLGPGPDPSPNPSPYLHPYSTPGVPSSSSSLLRAS